MGTSRHQEKSAAGKNKRLMRSYYFQGFFLVAWLVLGFVLFGFWVFFFPLPTKALQQIKSYRWYSPVEESSTCDFDLYLESSRAMCMFLMMMKQLFPVH